MPDFSRHESKNVPNTATSRLSRIFRRNKDKELGRGICQSDIAGIQVEGDLPLCSPPACLTIVGLQLSTSPHRG
jgi:hypothetical protein